MFENVNKEEGSTTREREKMDARMRKENRRLIFVVVEKI